MKVSEYIYQSRILLNDIEQPQAWSDEEFAIYADRAYIEMARLTRCIPDRPTATGSRALCTVPLATGIAEYGTNKKILEIHSVKHSALTYPLIKVSEPELDAYYTNWWAVTDLYPKYYLLDRQINKITLIPIPTFTSGTQKIVMTVARLPLISLLPYNAESNDLEPVDLREEWHLFLFDYIFYQAYSKDDIVTRNDKKAMEYLGKWLARIEEVKRDVVRRRRVDRAFSPLDGCI